MERRIINPWTWQDEFGYVQANEVSGVQRTLYCYRLDDLIAEDDRVAVRFTVTGTHSGLFAGIPATGKQVSMQGMIFHRLRDGKIVKDWVVRDTLGLLQQLGAIPRPGSQAPS